MKTSKRDINRRSFLKTSAAITTGLIGLSGFQSLNARDLSSGNDLFVIGPKEGYSPQIGTIVSMLNYNRQTIVNTVQSLTMQQLDHLHDLSANTIGALILHLGAVDKFYQINTFEGRQEFSVAEKKIWNAAMELGEEGRKQIKGKEVKYYLDMIGEVRQKTLEEFKKKDDEWLLAVDPKWSKERPLNTYWKWFHVCEHESNHRGQISWLESRLPGAKPSKD
jgi:uncharacterized damage-inducible protein DinB